MRVIFFQKVIGFLTILLLLFGGLVAIPVLSVQAESTSPHTPGTASGSDSPEEWVDWDNPNNISADDDLYVRAYFYMTGNTDYFRATDFQFEIPEKAVINGIELTISRFAEKAQSAPQSVRDLDVFLMKAGHPVGSNKGLPYTNTDWPAIETPINYGGAADLWGTTWTPTEINDANFGVAFKADSRYLDNTAYIDFMHVTVYYTYENTTLSTSSVSSIHGATTALSATLSPALSGRSISFTLDGEPACSGITDETGYATCTALVRTDAGTYPAGVKAIFEGDPPYAPSTATAPLVVSPREINVTAEDVSKPYNSPDPALTYTTSPALLEGESLPGELARDPGEEPGNYSIRQGSLSGGINYVIQSFTNGTFTITTADQVISVIEHAPARADNGTSFTVSATSSSGLPVSYSASGGCTNNGPVFTMTSSLQNCTVHYNQAGDVHYNPAPEVTELVLCEDAPLITLQPVDARVFPGQDAVFTAEAVGNPEPTVQWQVSTDGGGTFTNLDGETTSTLTIHTPPPSSNGYQYRAVFTNSLYSLPSQSATMWLLYYPAYLPLISR